METKPTNQINQTSLSGVLAEVKGPKKKRVPTHKKGERFLKGPIPWNWIVDAASVSGNAVVVSLTIWHLAGMTKTDTVKLSNKILRDLSIDRSGKYRALEGLEKAGLIKVFQKQGCSPLITILPAD